MTTCRVDLIAAPVKKWGYILFIPLSKRITVFWWWLGGFDSGAIIGCCMDVNAFNVDRTQKNHRKKVYRMIAQNTNIARGTRCRFNKISRRLLMAFGAFVIGRADS